jgi:hypothetical protein
VKVKPVKFWFVVPLSATWIEIQDPNHHKNAYFKFPSKSHLIFYHFCTIPGKLIVNGSIRHKCLVTCDQRSASCLISNGAVDVDRMYTLSDCNVTTHDVDPVRSSTILATQSEQASLKIASVTNDFDHRKRL